MTCRVTTYTYSRSLRALKALVRYRNTCGQYHASARPIKCKGKISTHSCRPASTLLSLMASVESGTLSLWSILLCILWIIPLDIFVKGTFHMTAERLFFAMNSSFRFVIFTGFRLGRTVRTIYQELVQAHGEAMCHTEPTVQLWVCEIKKNIYR